MAQELSRFLEELKSKNDIVTVVSRYVTLNQKGSKHWGCCPFHHEKTPSFAVDGLRQFYHCFGCKESGNVINFVEKVEATDFWGAVKILADWAGMEVPNFHNDIENRNNKFTQEERNRRNGVLKDVARYYHSMLNTDKAKTVNEYLEKRGISHNTAVKFGLGYSPDWTSSVAYLKSKGYTEDEIVNSGIAGKKDNRVYDAYGQRLMFPIINTLGNVVAFSGRILEGGGYAKYKNTGETDDYSKRNILYGLNLIKKLRLKQEVKNIILVEGQMDAISVYEAGFTNVVASMGTAFTSGQANQLAYYVGEVIISYDGDEAGIKGAILASKHLYSRGLSAKVVVMPDGLDPDEIIKRQGTEAYQKLLDEALPIVDFKMLLVRRKYDYNNANERVKFVDGMLKALIDLNNSSEEDFYLKQINKETGVNIDSLKSDLDSMRKGIKPIRQIVTDKPNDSLHTKAIRFILAHVLDGNSSFKTIEFAKDCITHNVHKVIFNYLEDKQGTEYNQSTLFELNIDDNDELMHVLDVKTEDKIEVSDEDKYFQDCLKILKKATLEKEREFYNIQYKTETDKAKRMEIVREIDRIGKELKAL